MGFGLVEHGLAVIRQRRELLFLILVLILFKLQFSELIGKVNTKGPVWQLLERMQRKLLTGDGCFLFDIGGKGVGGGEGDAAFFIPYLFPKGKIVACKGRISSLELIAARIEMTKEFQHKSIAQLIGGIHIEPVVKAGDIAAAQGAAGDILIVE